MTDVRSETPIAPSWGCNKVGHPSVLRGERVCATDRGDGGHRDPLPYSDTLHLDFLRAFGKDDVREVLMRLPVLYRAPLVLRYMDGFATKEIARMLDSPLGTILARLHRGRKRFEAEMWAYAEETGLLMEEAER